MMKALTAAATTVIVMSRSSLANTGFNAATGTRAESLKPEERLDLADHMAALALLVR